MRVDAHAPARRHRGREERDLGCRRLPRLLTLVVIALLKLPRVALVLSLPLLVAGCLPLLPLVRLPLSHGVHVPGLRILRRIALVHERHVLGGVCALASRVATHRVTHGRHPGAAHRAAHEPTGRAHDPRGAMVHTKPNLGINAPALGLGRVEMLGRSDDGGRNVKEVLNLDAGLLLRILLHVHHLVLHLRLHILLRAP